MQDISRVYVAENSKVTLHGFRSTLDIAQISNSENVQAITYARTNMLKIQGNAHKDEHKEREKKERNA